MDDKQRYHLKKLINELSKYRARHTELVSVYIPSGYDINSIINHLAEEQGTATNIKSKTTQKNVIAALERMIQHLRLFKQTPANGLAVFSGNVAEREGDLDVRVWSIEPPIPLNVRIYRCDKEFVLEPLKEMLDVKDFYGLIVIDKREATIGILKGKTIIPLTHVKSAVPGKTRAGGQSAPRFQRLRELAALDFYKKVGDIAKEAFFGKPELKGIIVGGPGPTKDEFLNKNYLVDELKRKIIGVKDITYTDEFGLQELLEKSEDLLQNEEVVKEKEIVNKFLQTLSKNPHLVSYGFEEIKRYLTMGAVDTLLISEDFDDEKSDELVKLAEASGAEVHFISNETREGAQLKQFGGLGAILRYNPDGGY